MADDNQAEGGAAEAATAPADENTLAFNLADGPETNPIAISVDLTKIPPAARRELLEAKVRDLINGRPHTALMRFQKEAKEYKAKCDADPTFSGTEPVAPNLSEIANQVVTDLYEGKVRQRNKSGSAKQRAAKDPVDAVVTQAVIRELFAKRKAKTPGTKYQDVVKEVGESGTTYLMARAKTIAGDNAARQAELEKSIENKYLAPARKMVSVNKAGEAQDNELL